MTKTEKMLSIYGIKPTEMRLKIYEYLIRKRYAVSLFDIKKSFSEKSETNKTANRTTFYRVIKLFLEKKMIHQIDDGTGMTKFVISREVNDDKNGIDLHMHFHCTNCEQTSCLPNSLPNECLPREHKANEVNLVIKGICKKCLK